jgi:putative endonuclease
MVTTKQVGEEGEARALRHLQQHGLRLVQRNYRVARGPHAHGGEIDLIMQAPDGTLVFVEVRQRGSSRFGGAAASIGLRKRQSLWRTARHFLRAYRSLPPCRFDVVTLEGETLTWMPAAFDAPPSSS